MEDKADIKVEKPEPKVSGEEEKRLKRRQSLEASVTLGLGYGKKKKQYVEAFYNAVWPVLKEAGWKLVSPLQLVEGRLDLLHMSG